MTPILVRMWSVLGYAAAYACTCVYKHVRACLSLKCHVTVRGHCVYPEVAPPLPSSVGLVSDERKHAVPDTVVFPLAFFFFF